MKKNERDLLRIIDANLNRLKEALRVCEEVTRFTLEDKRYTAKLKALRHEVLTVFAGSRHLKYAQLIRSRDSKSDVGRATIPQELERKDPLSILSANFQRSKESARVLEEFSKVVDRKTSERFKRIRFKIYDTEKVLIERI